MKREERIARFEAMMDQAEQAAGRAEKALAAYDAVLPALRELEAYYTGPDWKEDFAADEKGLLPGDLKRGVLSEDGVWNLLDRYRELKARIPKLSGKWMIASDIHGSAKYCRLMLEAFKGEQADRLLLLGDILYHGPRNDLPEEYDPKAVIAMLNGLEDKPLCVRGNCDTEVDQMVLEFPIMADYALLETQGHSLFATHGHLYGKNCLPPLRKSDILLQGHTHVPVWEDHDGRRMFNPGSVSIPKENSPHSYMILEEGVFRWKTLDGREYQTAAPN